MLTHALDHLKKADPIMAKIIEAFDSFESLEVHPKPPETLFQHLCDMIVGQQLSTKAADTIFARFKALINQPLIRPEHILQLDEPTLRSVGISRGKALYLQSLATAVADKKLVLESLEQLDNETVIAQLVQVKGIGQWTAEMFLMFALARPDVFSTGDLGLKNALIRWYPVSAKPTADEMARLSEKWQPYRTTAARVLWKSLTLPILLNT